jgi:hypothetical protein
VIQCVIDNGEYEGFRLSNSFYLDLPTGKGTLTAFLRRTGLSYKLHDGVHTALLDGRKVAVKAVREEAVKEHRFSALVEVEEKEKDTERIAVYNLTGFDKPVEDASLTLQKEPRQFYRD